MLTAIWDFLFHRHEWEFVEKGDIISVRGHINHGTYYVHICKKCKKLRQQKVYL